jgi:hypothetical protein
MEGTTWATDWAVTVAVAGGVAVTATAGAGVAVATGWEVTVADGSTGSGAAVGVGRLVAGAEVTVAAVLQAASRRQAARAIPIHLLNIFWASIIHTLSFMILIDSYH